MCLKLRKTQDVNLMQKDPLWECTTGCYGEVLYVHFLLISTKVFLCFPGATPPSSFPTRPMSLWSQTVPGLCYQPKWPESLWGLWWGTETVQVLPWWVCKLKTIKKTSIKKVSESSLIFSKRNIGKKSSILKYKLQNKMVENRALATMK